jgi:hypothetical protein
VPLTQAGLERPKDASGAAQAIPATLDNGYYSEAAVAALETLGDFRKRICLFRKLTLG